MPQDDWDLAASRIAKALVSVLRGRVTAENLASCTEGSKDLSRDVSLQTPDDFLLVPPFTRPADHIFPGLLMPAHSYDSNCMDRLVQLTIPASIEPVSGRSAR